MNAVVILAGLGALMTALFAVLVADHGRFLSDSRPCPPDRRVLIQAFLERRQTELGVQYGVAISYERETLPPPAPVSLPSSPVPAALPRPQPKELHHG